MLQHRWAVLTGCLVVLVVVTLTPRQLSANHEWAGYHWDGESLPVPLTVGVNLTTSEWMDHLREAIDDWNSPTGGATQSVSLSTSFGSSDPASCDPALGRIEVCNSAYGANGWLGLAQIWVYRGKGKHIAQATSLFNDTYFADPFYDTPAWRQMVMCQEIAHDFGLDHQDEDFWNYNLGTCMDYTAAPEGGAAVGPANTAPNQHDYDQLQELYAHIADGGGGGGGGGGRGGGRPQAGFFPDLPQQALPRVPIDSPAAWGQLVRAAGPFALYELDLGGGFALFTFVTWAQ